MRLAISVRRGRCTRRRFTRELSGFEQSSVMTDAAGQKREISGYSVCPAEQPQAKVKAQAQVKSGRRRVFRMCRSSN